METQMFGWFIQERELHRQALKGTKPSSKIRFSFQDATVIDDTFTSGLFEVRVQEYLDSIHDNEHRRVNRFLKGLGKMVSKLFHADSVHMWKKFKLSHLKKNMFPLFFFRKQNEISF